MTPRTQAIAYRIWGYCEPRGWDCTIREISDELDVPVFTVKGICQARGWHHRLRVVYHNTFDAPLYLANEVDEQGPVYI